MRKITVNLNWNLLIEIVKILGKTNRSSITKGDKSTLLLMKRRRNTKVELPNVKHNQGVLNKSVYFENKKQQLLAMF